MIGPSLKTNAYNLGDFTAKSRPHLRNQFIRNDIMSSQPRLSSRYRQNNVLQVGKEHQQRRGEIQLTERQLQLQKSKRRSPKRDPNDSSSSGRSFGDNPTTTAPTTSWGDSSSAASSDTFGMNPSDFYGQRNKGKPKLYDDTGASWHESKSEASESSQASSSAAFKQQLTAATNFNKRHNSPLRARKKLTTKAPETIDDYHSHQRRLLSTLKVEKEKEQTASSRRHTHQPRSSRRQDAKTDLKAKRLSSSRPIDSKSSGSGGHAADDEQLAFLRKVMKSYSRTSSSNAKQYHISTTPDEAKADQREDISSQESLVSTASSARSSKLTWSARKSRQSLLSASKSSSSSSTFKDKAIMMKFLARERKSGHSTSNPRMREAVAKSSFRRKKLVSPRKLLEKQGHQSSPRKKKSPHQKRHKTEEKSRRASIEDRPRDEKKKDSRIEEKTDQDPSYRETKKSLSKLDTKSIEITKSVSSREEDGDDDDRPLHSQRKERLREEKTISSHDRAPKVDNSKVEESVYARNVTARRRRRVGAEDTAFEKAQTFVTQNSPSEEGRNLVQTNPGHHFLSSSSSKATIDEESIAKSGKNFKHHDRDRKGNNKFALKANEIKEDSIKKQDYQRINRDSKPWNALPSKGQRTFRSNGRADESSQAPNSIREAEEYAEGVTLSRQDSKSTKVNKKVQSKKVIRNVSLDQSEASSRNISSREKQATLSTNRNNSEVDERIVDSKSDEAYRPSKSSVVARSQVFKSSTTTKYAGKVAHRAHDPPVTQTKSNLYSRNSISDCKDDEEKSQSETGSSIAAPHGYSNFLSAAQQEFQSYERKAKDQNKDVLEVIYSEEPEGYAEFLQVLQKEVSGSHSLLRTSFHSLFNGKSKLPKPLLAAESRVSNRSIKFDDKVKDTVTNMSNYLKRTTGVQCVPGTQLVNDKNARATTRANFGQHLLQRNKAETNARNDLSPRVNRWTKHEEESTFLDDDSDKENGGGDVLPHLCSTDTIDDDLGKDEFEVTLGQYVRRSLGAGIKGRHNADIKQDESISTSQFLKSNPSDDTLQCRNGDQLKKTNDTQTSKNRRVEPMAPPSSEGSLPWSGVRLRSIVDSDKSDVDDNASLPWGKVKLRRIENKPTSEGNEAQESQNDDNDDKIPQETTKEHQKDDDESRKEMEQSGEEKGQKDNELLKLQKPQRDDEEKKKLGEDDKTEASSTDVIDAPDASDKTGETVVVPLRRNPEHSDAAEARVVVGKRVLMKIQSRPGESKAMVIWRLDRDDVKSMTLDMSACSVRLLLTKDGEYKELSFTSSNDYMKFAKAVHELERPIDPVVEKKDLEAADDSIFVEQLNIDEQKLLEAYREKRRTQDPHDAMKDSLNDSSTTSPTEESQTEAPSQKEPLSVATTEAPSQKEPSSGMAPSQKKPPSVVDATNSVPFSPLSAASLSVDESKIAESYSKLLKLKIPKDAVRHKMTKDKVDPKVMGFVLGEDSFMASDGSSTGILSDSEAKVADLYKKMLKLMVPPEAVRHKMEKENVDQKIVFAVLGKDKVDGQVVENAANQLTGAEQALADSYQKMLKLMVPKEAVEHKMRKDGVDPKIMLVVVGGNPESLKNGGKTGNQDLTDEEQSIASAYRQMLKLQIPKDAVRHRMQKEQISDKIIAAVLGDKPSDTKASKTDQTQQRRTKPGFHWNPLPSGQPLDNSIWARRKPKVAISTSEAGEEISKHIELFQKKQNNTGSSKPSVRQVAASGEEKVMAKLIDLNRANNLAITLNSFKDFSYQELADIINYLDPLEKVKGDRVMFMRDLLPAPAEAKVISKYDGEDDRLVPAELWFKQIIHVKRVEEKVRVLRTIETFAAEANELVQSFQRLSNVCHQVMRSEKLPDLLEMVRHIGNKMNEGRGEARGFKLDFLPRLAQTKGTDRKTTALDLVVMIFVQWNQRDALMLLSDFPECQAVSKIQISELTADVRCLGGLLKKSTKELECLKKERRSKQSKRAQGRGDSKSEPGSRKSGAHLASRPSKSETKTGLAVAKNELFGSPFLAALKARSLQDDTGGDAPPVGELLKAVRNSEKQNEECLVTPRSGMLDSKEKSSQDEVVEAKYDIKCSISRIEKFLKQARKAFKDLESERDQAIKSCKELSDFFCETGGEKATSTLLGILSDFAADLDRAVKKFDQQQKVKERQQSAKRKKSKKKAVAQEKTIDTNEEKSSNTKSLVLMVTEMLKVAGDKAKEDFKKGIDYENPDHKLAAIYNREKERGQSTQPDSGKKPAKLDILSTIEKRKRIRGEHDAQNALSELALMMKKRASFDQMMEEAAEVIDPDDENAIDGATRGREGSGINPNDENATDAATEVGMGLGKTIEASPELAITVAKHASSESAPTSASLSEESKDKEETTQELASILQKRAALSAVDSKASELGECDPACESVSEKSEEKEQHITPELASILQRRVAVSNSSDSNDSSDSNSTDLEEDNTSNSDSVSDALKDKEVKQVNPELASMLQKRVTLSNARDAGDSKFTTDLEDDTYSNKLEEDNTPKLNSVSEPLKEEEAMQITPELASMLQKRGTLSYASDTGDAPTDLEDDTNSTGLEEDNASNSDSVPEALKEEETKQINPELASILLQRVASSSCSDDRDSKSTHLEEDNTSNSGSLSMQEEEEIIPEVALQNMVTLSNCNVSCNSKPTDFKEENTSTSDSDSEGLKEDDENQVSVELVSMLQKTEALPANSSDSAVSTNLEDQVAVQASYGDEYESHLDYRGRYSLPENTARASVSHPRRASSVHDPAEIRQRYIDRWTRTDHNQASSQTTQEEELDLVKTDSEILAADSIDSQEVRITNEKRQRYIDRWSRKDHHDLVEVSSDDWEKESDIGQIEAMTKKRRQRYVDRWASKTLDTEENPVQVTDERSIQGAAEATEEGASQRDEESSQIDREESLQATEEVPIHAVEEPSVSATTATASTP